MSALMGAAGGGHVRALAMLAEAGASLDLQNVDGVTALMAAAAQGQREVVRMLLLFGADRAPRSRRGLCALDAAQGNPELVELLWEPMQEGSDTEMEAAAEPWPSDQGPRGVAAAMPATMSAVPGPPPVAPPASQLPLLQSARSDDERGDGGGWPGAKQSNKPTKPRPPRHSVSAKVAGSRRGQGRAAQQRRPNSAARAPDHASSTAAAAAAAAAAAPVAPQLNAAAPTGHDHETRKASLLHRMQAQQAPPPAQNARPKQPEQPDTAEQSVAAALFSHLHTEVGIQDITAARAYAGDQNKARCLQQLPVYGGGWR
jgi:hypothetical protein